MGPEHARLDHHAEVWGKRHLATPGSRWGCRAVSSLPHRGGVHHTEVPVKGMTLAVAPLPLALDDDAVVLTRALTLMFGL
jgi:hypothetical protein